MPLVAWLEELGLTDVASVGGKNAALGELLRALAPRGINVPGGFATTATAYWSFIDANGLRPVLEAELTAFHAGQRDLAATGRTIRGAIERAALPEALRRAVLDAYHELTRREGREVLRLAVRSSATAEDLPGASFAGQQESFLNVVGDEALLEACKHCIASLFTDRAIAYREAKGFDHLRVALSVGVQTLVAADSGAAGVMFTVDTETGFPNVVLINAAYGLGESVVKGHVNPDEYCVWKPGLADAGLRPILRKRLGAKERTLLIGEDPRTPTISVATTPDRRARFALSDDEVLRLARWALLIEDEMGTRDGVRHGMDVEWVKDGETGELYVVQARPETVHATRVEGGATRFTLLEHGAILARGRSIGRAIATAPVCLIRSADDLSRFVPGSILVTEMTDPDWVPVLEQARGIITDRGGRTCHAAIVSRELGLPAIVGTGDATTCLRDGQVVTLCCAEGDEGVVYSGALRWREERVSPSQIPATHTKIMLNLAQPSTAFAHWQLPVDGVGLARIEFIVSAEIHAHPMALAHPERVPATTRAQLRALHPHYADGRDFFVETLARGVAMIAASQFPKPVIVRMSDFKTNEYAQLVGGADLEPAEDNPMLGFRGASRYYDPRYRDGFSLECRAIRYAREVLGLTNIALMIPFCRTLGEADRVLDTMRAEGLVRGAGGLSIWMMCEIPSNVILATQFAERFDGFSIGSNDLTQLILGIDRDSEILAPLFDERDPAVMAMIQKVIADAHAAGRPVGLCGQAPSDDPEFADALVAAGIDSISVNPDSAVEVKLRVAAFEQGSRSRPAAGGRETAPRV